MNPAEIKQAVNLFDTPEKWQAFLELATDKDKLSKAMHQTAYEHLKAYFLREYRISGWTYKPLDNETQSMIWYLGEYGENSICLEYGWQGQLTLEARGGETYTKVKQAAQLLETEQFTSLLAAFERIDEKGNGIYLANEAYNFSFGTLSDTRFDPAQLAWYGHFETEKFLAQIQVKIARFQTPEMTALLGELNQRTRR